MSKPMNYAAEKSGAQCNGMGAKRDPESTHAKVRQSAFSGLGDEASSFPQHGLHVPPMRRPLSFPIPMTAPTQPTDSVGMLKHASCLPSTR